MAVITQKELGYLIGFFIGDGYSKYNKKDRHYNVEFYFNSLKDKLMIEFIDYLLKKIGFNVCKQKDKRYNSIRLKISSKKFMAFLRERENEAVNENKIKDFNRDYRLGVISGLIDSDGYVRKSSIVISQKEKKNLIMVKTLCDSLGINSGEIKWKKNWKSKVGIRVLHIPIRFKYLPHNSYKIKRGLTIASLKPIRVEQPGVA